MKVAADRQLYFEPRIAGYDLLVHVPIVEQPSPDGFRSPDPAFQRAVDDRLMRELDERGLEAFPLHPAERGTWITDVEREVWARLAPAQLSLLPPSPPPPPDRRL